MPIRAAGSTIAAFAVAAPGCATTAIFKRAIGGIVMLTYSEASVRLGATRAKSADASEYLIMTNTERFLPIAVPYDDRTQLPRPNAPGWGEER
jgi:hypothetical protein